MADRGAARPTSGSVTVIVTVLKDPRVARTIESLLGQTRKPEEILVDDGGGTDEVERITQGVSARDPSVIHVAAPGNIAESRNVALSRAHGEFIAFLDADEVAPPGWLAALLTPFDDPKVGFVGGPTPALPGTATSIGARYYDGYLRRFYDRVARVNPHALPMGNSAWRAELFRRVGLLDTSLAGRIGNEDHEIAVRAMRGGFEGRYVPEASVDHDFSDITTWQLLRKQRRYAEGGYILWRREGSTYEATAGRVAPYVLIPLVAVAGAILTVPPFTRFAGELLLAAAGSGLALLALALTALGFREDPQYPGLRFQALEILRRWATLYGALRGLLRFGWKGPAAAPPP
ncbi:MAG: glycosyltransferase [Candidatus Lutacidiplasmatales archaeon]